MSVKTITIDMEAYGVLSRQKKPGQSFSQVIKQRLAVGFTGDDLLRALAGLDVSDDFLDAVDAQVRLRTKSRPRNPKL
jgi:predicted CopG family antitoxin